MLMQQVPSALVALLPVIVFLAALLWLDSYKLLAPSSVVAVIGVGAVMAAVSYPLNAFLLGRLDIGLPDFSRYVAPLTEELLKGLVVLALVRMHRIGFLVDAAIYGFAVGTGFALAENLYYLHLAAEAGMGTWIVRGFGTALMHGGTTALFAVMGLARVERAATCEGGCISCRDSSLPRSSIPGSTTWATCRCSRRSRRCSPCRRCNGWCSNAASGACGAGSARASMPMRNSSS